MEPNRYDIIQIIIDWKKILKILTRLGTTVSNGLVVEGSSLKAPFLINGGSLYKLEDLGMINEKPASLSNSGIFCSETGVFTYTKKIKLDIKGKVFSFIFYFLPETLSIFH